MHINELIFRNIFLFILTIIDLKLSNVNINNYGEFYYICNSKEQTFLR